ncbi:MAG: type II toxin-antitoxin system VapC family toxin [Candidatus Thermoplasmatota archaeon]|jgi:predicted nucleic acid-binding protein|nr:type II toxin-antitoxin system VapC family toxin [Candidatus Thermoplasmatota archaeon]
MNLLDASAIFNLFQSGKYSTLVAGATIPLASYEIGNILWKNHNIRNRISKKEATESGSVLFELIDSMEQIVPSPGSALRLSLEEGLTFYDSSYLISAIESGYDLVTDDLKLHKIASSKVPTVKTADL